MDILIGNKNSEGHFEKIAAEMKRKKRRTHMSYKYIYIAILLSICPQKNIYCMFVI